MILPRQFVLAGVPLAMACAAAVATAQQPAAQPMSKAAVARAIQVAKTQFDTAASKGDLEGMARWLAEDAIVVSGRDTLKGSEAIMQFLRTGLPGATSARFYFQPERMEYCTDGAYEYGGEYTIHVRRRLETADTLRGRYALRWTQDGADGVRVHGVAVAPTRGSATPELHGCVWSTRVAFDRRRVRLSLFMPFGLAPSNTVASLEARFRRQGYYAGFASPANNLNPTRRGTAPWQMIGLRLRLGPRLSVEGIVALQSRTDTITGFNQADSSFLRVTNSRSLTAAAIVSYEWRRLRVGAGPLFLEDSWSIQQVKLFGVPFGWVNPFDAWKERRLGVLLEAAYTFPVSSRMYIEVRAQRWSVPSRDIHGTPGFPSAPVDTRSYLLALALGAAF